MLTVLMIVDWTVHRYLMQNLVVQIELVVILVIVVDLIDFLHLQFHLQILIQRFHHYFLYFTCNLYFYNYFILYYYYIYIYIYLYFILLFRYFFIYRPLSNVTLFAPAADKAAAIAAAAASANRAPPFVAFSLLLKRLNNLSIYFTILYNSYQSYFPFFSTYYCSASNSDSCIN